MLGALGKRECPTGVCNLDAGERPAVRWQSVRVVLYSATAAAVIIAAVYFAWPW